MHQPMTATVPRTMSPRMLPLGKPKGERWLVPSGAIDRPCDPKKRRTKPKKKYKYKGTCTFPAAGSNKSSQNRPTMVNDKTARTLPCGRPKGCRGTGTSTVLSADSMVFSWHYQTSE